jgi:hypothetical protein
MEPIEGSETSAYIYQTPGNYPKENLLYSEHGESLKSRITTTVCVTTKKSAVLGDWDSFPGRKRPGRDVDQSRLPGTEVKNV